VTGPPTTLYVSATFTTPWPVTTSLESRFQTFVESKYGITVSRRAQCFTGPTMDWAETYRAKVLPPPSPGYRHIETGWTPEAATGASSPGPKKSNSDTSASRHRQ